MDDLSATQVYFVTQGSKLFFALLAVYAVVWFSAWLDRRMRKRGGVTFAQAAQSIVNDARASAFYLGARWLGICLLVGLVIAFS